MGNHISRPRTAGLTPHQHKLLKASLEARGVAPTESEDQALLESARVQEKLVILERALRDSLAQWVAKQSSSIRATFAALRQESVKAEETGRVTKAKRRGAAEKKRHTEREVAHAYQIVEIDLERVENSITDLRWKIEAAQEKVRTYADVCAVPVPIPHRASEGLLSEGSSLREKPGGCGASALSDTFSDDAVAAEEIKELTHALRMAETERIKIKSTRQNTLHSMEKAKGAAVSFAADDVPRSVVDDEIEKMLLSFVEDFRIDAPPRAHSAAGLMPFEAHQRRTHHIRATRRPAHSSEESDFKK